MLKHTQEIVDTADCSAELNQIATDWWRESGGALMPGEDDGVTVTGTSVFERLVVELPTGRCMPIAEGVQRRAGGAGRLIDTAVVTKVVTGFARVRFELENWSKRQYDLLLYVGAIHSGQGKPDSVDAIG